MENSISFILFLGQKRGRCLGNFHFLYRDPLNIIYNLMRKTVTIKLN